MDNQFSFSNNTRNDFINESQNKVFDILVIGGGVTGLRYCFRCCFKGLSVCLMKNTIMLGAQVVALQSLHGGLKVF
ncbi:MAG: hypothetical protein R2836_07465 [Chitinophagales bacterium]